MGDELEAAWQARHPCWDVEDDMDENTCIGCDGPAGEAECVAGEGPYCATCAPIARREAEDRRREARRGRRRGPAGRGAR